VEGDLEGRTEARVRSPTSNRRGLLPGSAGVSPASVYRRYTAGRRGRQRSQGDKLLSGSGLRQGEPGYTRNMAALVYLETSIISYLTAWPSRDLIVAGRQQLTQEGWNSHVDASR
jgi:hypothetical protein